MAMYDSLYPRFGVARLREQHGFRWADIVDQVHGLHVTDPHVMAFTLTIKKIRRQHHITAPMCSDPFCAVCTAEILEHYGGSEDELISFYLSNLREIQQTMKLMQQNRVERFTQLASTGTAG